MDRVQSWVEPHKHHNEGLQTRLVVFTFTILALGMKTLTSSSMSQVSFKTRCAKHRAQKFERVGVKLHFSLNQSPWKEIRVIYCKFAAEIFSYLDQFENGSIYQF